VQRISEFPDWTLEKRPGGATYIESPRPGQADLSGKLREIRVDQQGLGFFVAGNPRIFPSNYIGDACVADSPALLVGEFARKHRGHYRVSTHTLLFTDVLDRKPANRVFLALGRSQRSSFRKSLSTLRASDVETRPLARMQATQMSGLP
jgi:hypothetical protein